LCPGESRGRGPIFKLGTIKKDNDKGLVIRELLESGKEEEPSSLEGL